MWLRKLLQMKTLGAILAVIAFIVCAAFFQQNAPTILNSIKDLGWLAPVLFMLLYCLATILLLPTMVLTLAGGALFGTVFGTILNLIGATLGAACAFCLTRYLALDWLASKKGPKVNKLITGVERSGWQFVAMLRLVPIIPFNLVNYGLGLTHIKFSQYIITTFIFLTPAEFIFTYFGHAGMDVLTHPSPFYKNSSIIIVFSLGLLFLVIELFKHYHRRLAEH